MSEVTRNIRRIKAARNMRSAEVDMVAVKAGRQTYCRQCALEHSLGATNAGVLLRDEVPPGRACDLCGTMI